MIDKNGKLFGKINIIDLLILLVVVVAVILVGARVLRNDGGAGLPVNSQTVRITFYGTDVYDFLPDSLTLGDPVTQYTTEINLGTLVSFAETPAWEYAYDSDSDETVQIPVRNRCFLTFVSEASGRLDSTGLTIGDTTFVVGGNYWVNVGPTRAYYQIRSFEVIG